MQFLRTTELGQPYGDLTLLNHHGEIRNAVDPDLLKSIVTEYLDLLLSSAAVYEKNGDYAIGIFSSGWCKLMDSASRDRCQTSDNTEALSCGKWLCHESCWETSKKSMQSASPCDLPCNGGIRIFAVPIYAGEEIIGSINFGYGDPPSDPKIIEVLARKFDVDPQKLPALAERYQSRSPEVISEAKERLKRAARFIGEIVLRRRTELRLRNLLKEKQGLIEKVTQEKQNAEKAKSEAELANLAKSKFLANMSHEIRTPISVISGYLDLLSIGKVSDEEAESIIAVTRKNCDHLTQIIDDILDLSKVEAGKMVVDRHEVNLNRIIHEVISILQEKARRKGLKLLYAPSSRLPKKVQSNAIRVRQILLNIIGNAIKFTERGSVKVTAQLDYDRTQKNGFVVRIRVKDTGCGISAKDQKNLFNPFVQVDDSFTRQNEGTGLGLALSRKFARALGGDLVIGESKIGFGSTFEITLEPGSFDQFTFFAPDVEEDIEKRTTVDLDDLANRNVLIVEDNLELQDRISKLLELHGVNVQKASNGEQGVSMAQEKPYDVLFMDMKMPVLDGYSAIKRLRESGYCNPIVALTAHAMYEDRARLKKCGCDEYLTKPISNQALLAAVGRHLKVAKS